MSPVPIIDAGGRGALGLALHDPARAARLRDVALATHPALALFGRALNTRSRRLLAGAGNPYRDELEAVAGVIGPRGVFVLNMVYEWGCSTACGPDLRGTGNAMLRVLDWPMRGIGPFSVIGRFTGPAGAFAAVTWPGFAGVLTGMAPGRFSAAINQPPAAAPSGVGAIDAVLTRLQLAGRSAWPASHLLRHVFEHAHDFAHALRMLCDPRYTLATPALFIVSGRQPHEAAVVEAAGRVRRVAPEYAAGAGTVGCANMWLSRDLGGRPRAYATDPRETASDNNRRRRALAIDALGHRRMGFADLPSPVLNPSTLQIVRCNAALGDLTAAALDHAPGQDRKRSLPGIALGPTAVSYRR